MSETISRTQDGSLFETWNQGGEGGQRRAEPRVRLLYHVDLDRIGGLFRLDPDLSEDQWTTFGRRAPAFIQPGGTGIPVPLDDPTISREQLRIRFSAADERFEVEPLPGAKRKLGVVVLAEGDDSAPEASITTIHQRVSLPPGTCVAIEDRVLLGLELVGPRRAHSADRLGLVGESPSMWRLRDDIREVAEFRRPALVIGQTGAGKELVARAVHQMSARAEQPFVTVNCAALPEHLVESLLFGHQKGAFTGADQSQTGVFRAAHGGTLFLDELGEMPMSIQPKLLRTIQEGQVTAVGQHRSVEVDVRLIAATNRDLEQEILAQRMRADLYHRVSAHILRVPPLSARRFDIPELFVHFLSRLRDEHPQLSWMWTGGQQWKKTVSVRFFIDLMNAHWTGNVRQLQNIVERTARLNLRAESFRAPELPMGASGGLSTPAMAVPGPPAPATADRPAAGDERLAVASRVLVLAHKTVAKLLSATALQEIFAQVQREGGDDERRSELLHARAAERLFELLEEHDFKQRGVAATLEVSRSTLVKLMNRFGLPRPTDLSWETIQTALAAADGDMERAATALKVSPQGLKKRLTVLNLKRQKG